VIFGRFTFSQGFLVLGREPGLGGGILASDDEERLLKKRFRQSVELTRTVLPDPSLRSLLN
jgi:hypothetical protein